jgi:serine/threonine protein kinase
MDLDSRNGVWVDDRRVKEHVLADGDVFSLGKSISLAVKVRDARAAPAGAHAGRKVVFPSRREAEPSPAPIPEPEVLPPLEGPMVGLPGTQLGEFRILEQASPLGRATFFRALQPSLNRHVLVEVFTENDISRPGVREALQKGVQRVAPLLHPNILQIFDYGSARGFTWVTMEHFQGRTLRQVLSEKGFVPIPRAVSVARQLCEAFTAGIDHDVAVGSVTPSDVWLDEDFTVKVKLFREPGAPPNPVEDFAYQAPEVLAGGEASEPRAAVYCVSALLYHMLAATPPVTGATREEIARRARHDTPLPLKRTNIKVPPILTRVVEQGLSKDPARRQDGVRALAREIQRSVSPTL